MATVTVRGLDPEVLHRLKIRAATHGRSMEAEVRAILALAVEAAPATEEVPTSGPAPTTVPVLRGPVLSPREGRVAELVAQGLTNRQIAALLFLSERTVESHVSSILRKLGCARRATVASWVATRHAAESADHTVVPRMTSSPGHH